jgi:hypothetical protein
LHRGGVDFREEDGHLLVKTQQGCMEFVFDREARLAGGAEGIRVVLPGTRAFEAVTRGVREQTAHHVVDATMIGLDQVRETLEAQIRPVGMILEGLSEVGRTSHAAVRAAVRAAVAVASDRYETVLELDHAREDDGVARFLGAADELRGDDGQPLPRCPEAELKPLGERVAGVAEKVIEQVKGNSSVQKFCNFYEDRYREDLERLLEHARSLGHKPPGISAEEAVESVARRDASVRAALGSLKLRFLPTLRVEPVGVTGIRYDEVELEARIRNRNQREAHPVRLAAVPLTGVLKSTLPGADQVPPGADGWACPSGHITLAEKFVRCTEDECTVGACSDCIDTPRVGALLAACTD